MAKLTAYTVVGATPYHYAGGVIVPGQSVELTDEEASRGIASGVLVPSLVPPKAMRKAPAASEELI